MFFKRPKKDINKKSKLTETVSTNFSTKDIQFVDSLSEIPDVMQILSGAKGKIEISESQRLSCVIYVDPDKNIVFLFDNSSAYKQEVERSLMLLESLWKKEIIKLKTSASFILDVYNSKKVQKETRAYDGEYDVVVQEIFASAIEKNASDIHIRAADGRNTQILFRIHGDLELIKHFPESETNELFNVIYNNYLESDSKDGVFQRSATIDSRIATNFPKMRHKKAIGDKVFNFRYSSANRANNGCSVVLRLLDSAETTHFSSLKDLGYNKYVCRALMPILKSSEGSVYVVGPTGSGKSLTLKTILDIVGDYHQGRKHILTIEDPVEYKMKHAQQQGVQHQTNDTPEQRKNNYFKIDSFSSTSRS